MPLLLLLCRFVSILQPKSSCRPECLVFVTWVHNGKISRVSQSLLELNCTLASAHTEKTKGVFTITFHTLASWTKGSSRCTSPQVNSYVCVCSPKDHGAQSNQSNEHKYAGWDLNKKFDFIIHRLAVLSFQLHMNCLHFFCTKILSYNERKVHLTNRICTRNSHSCLSWTKVNCFIRPDSQSTCPANNVISHCKSL